MSNLATAAGMIDVAGVPAYLAVPEGEDPWPGLVLVHEIYGLDDQMRGHADRLAGLGFLTLAPDLFTRGRRLTCLRATFSALAKGTGAPFDDIAATRARLLADPRCNGRVGLIGFCMGGGFALALAGSGDYDAVAPNYGRPPADPGALDDSCPVVASYGGRDGAMRGVADRLRTQFDAQGVPNDVKEYPAAGHGFLNTVDVNPWWMAPMSRFFLHAGHEPASAADAWARIDAFLHQHLDAPDPAAE